MKSSKKYIRRLKHPKGKHLWYELPDGRFFCILCGEEI
jgi:hypothetical protein